MNKSGKKLISLHVMVYKKDVELMDAFCANHGDRSLMVRHLIKSFCDELREGNKLVLPLEVRAQIVDYKKEKEEKDHEDINDEI